MKPALTFLLFSLILSVCARAAERPNVLVIFTDDHRFSGVHALGGMAVQTPNMDRLCDQGFVFTEAFLQGSMHPATCIPSRHMFLTGRGLFDIEGRVSEIPPSSTMMGEAFREAGYQTYHVGKWHNDRAALTRSADAGGATMGFAYLRDHFRMPLFDWDPSGQYSQDAAYLLSYDDAGKLIRRPIRKDDVKMPIGTETDGPHSSEIFASSAIDIIEHHDGKGPFFMYLAFHAPHDPRQAPEAYRELYPPESIELPPSYLPQHPFDNGEMTVRDERLAFWPRTPEIARQQLANYYAIITHLDTQIGRVLAALERSGKADNTIIVLAGDSGLAVGNHGLMGKQNLYDEDGLHVPLVFAGQLKGNGQRIPAFSYLHDVFPTLCELAGIAIPESVTGKSLAPLIRGEAEPIREFTYHAYKDLIRAYRKGDYKLIEHFRATNREGEDIGSRVTQLFNLRDDPWETRDLSFLGGYRDQVKQMQAEMAAVAAALGDDTTRD